MSEVIKAYKGFEKDMTCRGFKFEEGKEYEEEGAEVCEKGFHACEMPLDVFNYYPPESSVYHEVEQSGEISKSDENSKVASSKIKIGAKIGIPGLVKAQIEFVKEKCGETKKITGDWSANSATGNRSANSATGNRSANSATGYGSANSATGDWSANSATGYGSANSATGNRSANSATGYGSANVSTGAECTNSGGEATLCAGWGKANRCKGDIGSYLVLSEWGDWDGAKYPLLSAEMICIDGKKYKADTWYTLINGEIVEWEK